MQLKPLKMASKLLLKRLQLQKAKTVISRMQSSNPDCSEPSKIALVLGLYVDEKVDGDNGHLTATAERFANFCIFENIFRKFKILYV